jgi:hypothetical protein
LVTLLGAAFGYAMLHPGTSRADQYACETPFRGFDFDTFELENYKTQYAMAIQLAAAGKAAPAAYTLGTGEAIDMHYVGLASGPRSARLPVNPAMHIPATVFESITWIESSWSNAGSNIPYGGVGPLLVSFDCGYGMAQITSGMGHLGGDAFAPGVPSARQALIGTDFLFNLAEGARILAAKWNGSPEFRPIAGNGDPTMLEDWYYAIWAYNGFAFSNHPLNPNLDPLRGGGTSSPVYHCNDPAAPGYVAVPGGVKYGSGSYTYPERVYGCMRYPPKTTPLPPGPSAATVGPKFVIGDHVVVFGTGDCLTIRTSPGVSSARIVPEPGGCIPDGTPVTITGGPVSTSGTDGNYNWWQGETPIGVGWMAEPFLAKATELPPVDPANRLWPPQVFNMPDLSNETVAAAFRVASFAACDASDSFLAGCPAMDFPTGFASAAPPLRAHADTTPPVDPSLALAFIGNPQLVVTGPTKVTLDSAPPGGVQLIVKNAGTWIAPFRIRTSANWIVVRHPGDPPARTLDGGVAIGSETDVVVQQASGTARRSAQKGYQSVLWISADPALLPDGTNTGTVFIEPLLGGGSAFVLTVTATGSTGAANVPPGYHFRSLVPAISGDGGN